VAKKALAAIGATDQRHLTRKILIGEITAEDLAAHLTALPDLSDQAGELKISWEPRGRAAAAGGSGDAD